MVDFETLKVTFDTVTYHTLFETGLWYGEDINDLPVDADGQPILEDFPFYDPDIGLLGIDTQGVDEYSYTINLDSADACSDNGEYSLKLAPYALTGDRKSVV